MELLHIRNWTWNTECLKNVKLLVYYLHRVELRIEVIERSVVFRDWFLGIHTGIFANFMMRLNFEDFN